MRYTTRPLSDRTWLRPDRERTPSRFDASWPDTLDLLGREIGHLRGRDVVIEVDVRERDIRLNGGLRSTARAETPAVVIAFDTPGHGPMLYRSDRYNTGGGSAWQHNVRAIAKTLEALRAVDRYGATETGQQYTGFKALPAGRAMPPSHMTTDEARAVITHIIGPVDRPWDTRIRLARREAHPDRNGGDRTLWDKVEQAARVLGVLT